MSDGDTYEVLVRFRRSLSEDAEHLSGGAAIDLKKRKRDPLRLRAGLQALFINDLQVAFEKPTCHTNPMSGSFEVLEVRLPEEIQ